MGKPKQANQYPHRCNYERMSNQTFYQDLPRRKGPLKALFGEPTLFQPVPEDWQVIVVDIMGSTQAVKSGLHHEVNLAATGSIIAVLNYIRARHGDLVIPYWFGGDGATFLVPPNVCDGLITTLDNYRHHVKRQFAMSLRVGSVAVREIYAAGHTIRLVKAQLNGHLVVPIALGNGLKYGESLIKSCFVDKVVEANQGEAFDLTGMECRWNEIAPPVDEEQILCLIVTCDLAA